MTFGFLTRLLGLFVVLSAQLVVEGSKQKCFLQPHNKEAALHGSPTSTGAHGAPASVRPTSTFVAAGSTSTGATSSPAPAFNYGTDKIRGVNLGGWFVLEPWITPSLFQNTGNENIIDEFTLGQLLDQQTALSILTSHWQTWITEEDFVAIQAAGLTHVRIPIGYWSVPLTSSDTSTSTSPAPYTPGAWPYILQALDWAQSHNIRVILDLHGAPGSQNGYDNSGERTSNPAWALNADNVTRTVDTLRFLAKTVGDKVDVIEMLNEAAGFRGDDWAAVIRQFWMDGYEAVRGAVGEGVNVMIGDAFLGVANWDGFLTAPQAQGVLMDFHEYQIFSDLELNRTMDEHVQFACTYIQTLGDYATSNLWTVVGEWSNAITDCAQWLNGRGIGARWDNSWFPGPTTVFHGSCDGFTGSLTGFSDDYKTFLRKYWEVQVEVGENVQGWIFWTWKTEAVDEWSYQKGLEGGWIPNDPTERMFPNLCS